MVLFDQIIEILRRPHLCVLGQRAISLHLAHGPVRGGIPIERDRLRWPPLMFDCLAEKGFCRSHIALCPEHEVYCLADPIHRPI